MTDLFKRAWQVTIVRNEFTTTERRFFLPLPDGHKITLLRTEFEIEKSLERSPNTCTVKLTNLSEATREELQHPGIVVKLDAGYDGVLRPMFIGDLTWARSTQEETEWITEMAIGDGARAFTEARRNKSYDEGTKVVTILREAAAKMNLTLPPEVERLKDFQNTYAAGFVTSGRTRDELTRLLAPYGYTWSIQDGRLQILRDEEVLGTSRLISPSTGMIGSPEFDKPTQRRPKRSTKYRGPKATIKMLLYPELTPGHRVEVQSRALNGMFKIHKVKHQGDSHGDEWTTEIEVHA